MAKLRNLPIITFFLYTCLSIVRFNDGASDRHRLQPQTVASSGVGTKGEKNLVLNGDGIFKIAMFADLHLERTHGVIGPPLQDVGSIGVMSNVIDHENPDFVVYLGDVITANNIGIQNASLYWEQAISPARAKGIPWATVFGNHDDAHFEWPIEWFSPPGVPQLLCPLTNSTTSSSCPGKEECSFKGTSRLELMKNEIEKNELLSHSKIGPKDLWPSVSNYVLKLSSSEDPNTTLAFFYVLDSGGGTYPQIISTAQIEWFNSTTQNLNPDSRVPEIVFWHIPSEAYEKVAPMGVIQKPCVGSINEEKVAPQQVETGIMKLLLQRPSVKAIFSGHNHGLDWCCPYNKLWLCFGRHSGYGGYGGKWQKGSRILQITQHPFSIKSWIRMEDGHVHSQLLLFNSTLLLNTSNFHYHYERSGWTVSLRMKEEKWEELGRRSAAFKIALFADLHFGENAWSDWGPKQDENSIRVMSNVLDYETPDFVIYLGDVITANNIAIKNASLYWNQAISPTRERGIPFATVFGNHDDATFQWPIQWFSTPGIPQILCPLPNSTTFPGEEECSFKGTTRLELMKIEVKHNHMLSHSKSGPKELWPSVSNYVLKLSSPEDPDSPVAFLYFLDSGGGSYPQLISSAQVEWFNSTTQNINPNSRVPEVIFWHIPSKAYKKVAPIFGIHKPCVGSINKERVATQEVENGIMELLVESPSVKAVFVGHNHGLDWCCPHNQLWLCFARHTGYGGYGSWARGSRIVEITQHPFSIRSWIRMEDGHVHSEVVLE
ncbi:hypothetical protein F8388_025344 [Cannabis sativa]|uniref:Calcineurin-like phosphoesterase domain-containing protein n=1 Tax=Cannabis sativa TaxID=3483 RepID=A0A7J6FV90_CANSA|nr:hypothetical protein F8388_025344 [Cannabis sativa]